MSITTLLSPENAPLRSVQLLRVQLNRAYPVEQLSLQDEVCCYSLIGTVQVRIENTDYGLLGRRSHIREASVEAIRATYGLCTFTLIGDSADLLVMTAPRQQMLDPFVHRNDVYHHRVGSGTTHERLVRELHPPSGYRIHMGETLNVVGGWSSWPAHAVPEEGGRYAEHEEVFYVITPGYGIMRMRGRYATGEDAPVSPVEIGNNTALVTPLGSHEIVFSPDAWGWYAWGYISFLQKTYNQWAHEGVRQYVK